MFCVLSKDPWFCRGGEGGSCPLSYGWGPSAPVWVAGALMPL